MPPRAVVRTLDELLSVLGALGVPLALLGGLALAVWKHVRATRDVDLLVGVDPTGAESKSLLETLHSAGFNARRTPAVVSLGAMHALQLSYEPKDEFIPINVDLLFAASKYQRTALERSLVVTLPEISRPIPVLRCEDLILHKLLAGRLIDRSDIVSLLMLNQSELDEPYLQSWSESLGVHEEYEVLRQQAFAAQG